MLYCVTVVHCMMLCMCDAVLCECLMVCLCDLGLCDGVLGVIWDCVTAEQILSVREHAEYPGPPLLRATRECVCGWCGWSVLCVRVCGCVYCHVCLV